MRFQTSHSRSRLDTCSSPQSASETDLQPTDARAPPSDRAKSSVRPIPLQVAQEFVNRHDRLARWRSAPDRDRRGHPPLPEGVEQQGVRQHRTSRGARWADFRNNPVAIGDQNRFATGGKPKLLTPLILERFEANGTHGIM